MPARAYPAGRSRPRSRRWLCCDADDLLLSGDVTRARSAYLDALERVPRHSGIVARIADIDARTSGRAEAALALLAEARQKEPVSSFGLTPGELLVESGDVDGALASFERTGNSEPAPALAARAYEAAARIVPDPETAIGCLDMALARSPRSTTARWARVEKRLALGRIEEALADAEHLEALARGTAAKHAVWLRAGTMWQAAEAGRPGGHGLRTRSSLRPGRTGRSRWPWRRVRGGRPRRTPARRLAVHGPRPCRISSRSPPLRSH